MHSLKTVILFFVLFAAPVLSQTAPSAGHNTCNASVVPDMIHGDYEITAGPLAMTIAGNTFSPDPKTTGTGTIYPGPLGGFMVRMTPPIPDFRLEETDRMQPDWYWDAAPVGGNKPNLFLSSKDLELVVNCSIREMPRFIGRFQTQAQDGSSLNHTIRLVMALPNFLVGSWRFTAQTSNGPISGLRYVIFDRKAPNIGN